MANIAQAIGYALIAISSITAVLGLMAYETGGILAILYGISGIVSGVIITCLGMIVENTARTAAAQERLMEKLAK